MSTTPDTSHAPGSSPEKQALLEAFDTVLKTQAEERAAARAAAASGTRPSRALLLLCLATVCVTVGYLALRRPAWAFPAPPTPESAALREAGLRMAMATAAQHVERYRERTGHLPATLEQAGAHAEGMVLEPTTAGYRLTGRAGDLSLSLDSAEPLAQFVGNSFTLIGRRRP